MSSMYSNSEANFQVLYTLFEMKIYRQNEGQHAYFLLRFVHITALHILKVKS